jgi:hypothetical protein
LRLDRAVSAERNERADRHWGGCNRNASRRGYRGTEAQCETGKCAGYRLNKVNHDLRLSLKTRTDTYSGTG